MALSPAQGLVTCPREIRTFAKWKLEATDVREALLPRSDITLPKNALILPRTPDANAVSRHSPYHSAWSIEKSGDEAAHKIYVSRAVPNSWNFRSAYEGPGFDAKTEETALTMLFRVTGTIIEAQSLYFSRLCLKDQAANTKEFARQESKLQKNILKRTALSELPDETPIRYFQSKRTGIQLETTIGIPSRHGALHYLANVAHLCASDVLKKFAIAQPTVNGIAHTPWFTAKQGEAHISRIALHQLCSIVSENPALTTGSVAKYSGDLA